MKRQFNKEEKEMSEKNLGILKKEQELINGELKIVEFHLIPNIGIIDFNYKKTIADFKKKKKQLDIRLQQVTNTINTLQNQIDNGVEVKSKSKKR